MRKFYPGKAESWQYKRDIPPCSGENFYVQLQDIIYVGAYLIPVGWDKILSSFVEILAVL